MFQQMFANYFKVAESAIQFQHELLRQWSGQCSTAPFAGGRTRQARAMQQEASEDGTEMLNFQRMLLAMMTEPDNRLIEDVPAAGKRVVQETERVGGEVRKEEMRVMRVEPKQDVDMHAAPSWHTITADRGESEVLRRAYLKWLEEGCPEGQDRRHYFEALQRAR